MMTSASQQVVINVCEFREGERRQWDEYVLQNSLANHSHYSGWSQVVESSYRHKSLYLWARENGKN